MDLFLFIRPMSEKDRAAHPESLKTLFILFSFVSWSFKFKYFFKMSLFNYAQYNDKVKTQF